MANYEQAFNFMIIHEIIRGKCVYTNDSDDNGGETCYGITRKNFPDWEGWEIVDKNKIRNDFPFCLVENEELDGLAFCFYKDEFWEKIQGEAISDQPIANKVLDMSVPMGIHNAIVLLQKAIGDTIEVARHIKPHILSIDGKMGSFTIGAINNVDPIVLLDKYKQRCINYFKQLNQPKFETGWIKRALA